MAWLKGRVNNVCTVVRLGDNLAAALSSFYNTTREANLAGGELNKVSLTGLTDTSALCSAPVRPAIEMQQAVRHRACVASEVIQGSNPGT